jgi:hypothetical protein
MKALRVTYVDGMVNVDSDDIRFAWIPEMYQGNRAGVGLQVNSHLDRKAVARMCLKIADAVAEFNGQPTAAPTGGPSK